MPRNAQMSNFIKIRLVGAEQTDRNTDRQIDRQTDRHDCSSRFS